MILDTQPNSRQLYLSLVTVTCNCLISFTTTNDNDMVNISDRITHDEALLYQYIKVQFSERQTHSMGIDFAVEFWTIDKFKDLY